MNKNNDKELKSKLTLEERVKLIEKLVHANRIQLVKQEHRFFDVVKNLMKSFRFDNISERLAAIEAFFYILIPGRITLVIAGGGLVGLISVLLMQKSNELAATQNYYLQQQIYVQALADRNTQIIRIKEYLYKATTDSQRKMDAWEADPKKKKGTAPTLEPYYNKHIRETALKQYLDLETNPLLKPALVPKESLFQLVIRWMCDNFSFYCIADDMSSHKQKEKKFYINLENSLLSGIKWPAEGHPWSVGGKKWPHTVVLASGADFRRADLTTADLRNADLFNANLSNVYANDILLQGANLQHANLTNADLSKAFLTNTDLRNATLTGTRLWRATLKDAVIHNLDLRQTVSLNCSQITTAIYWKSAIFTHTCDGKENYPQPIKIQKHELNK